MTNGYLLLYQDDDYRLYGDDDGGNDGDYTWDFQKMALPLAPAKI